MAEEGNWDSKVFDKKMKDSKTELSELQEELQAINGKICSACLKSLSVHKTRTAKTRRNCIADQK